MRRGSRFERLGYFFESVGAAVERRGSRERDPVKSSVRRACYYLFILVGFIALMGIVALFNGARVWVGILILVLDVTPVVAAVRAMRTPAPVASFLWLVLAIVLLGVTMTAFVLLSRYA